MRYILASGSPRRKELLKFITKNFDVVAADIKEDCPPETAPKMQPQYLALKKAQEVAKNHQKDVVIGADTAVFLGEEMLGKPKDTADAERMLKSLSGKTHCVITGCAIIYKEKEVSFSVCTKVKFLNLTNEQIVDYINTNEPFDKAGAYGIQGYGSLLVESIEGDYFNVVGLPISALNAELKKLSK